MHSIPPACCVSSLEERGEPCCVGLIVAKDGMRYEMRKDFSTDKIDMLAKLSLFEVRLLV